MPELDHQTSGPSYVVGGEEINWEDLPDEIKVEALSEAVKMLASQGYSPFTPTEISESLGPEQLRLIASTIEFSDEEMELIAENISAESVNREGLTNQKEAEKENMNSNSLGQTIAHAIDIALFDRPQATFYSLGLILMLYSFYFSSIYYALSGVFVMLITALHYAN